MSSESNGRRWAAAPTGGLPRLAVVFEPTAVQFFDVVDAATDTWETVWLIDRSIEGLGNLPRLLARSGEVIDTTGLDPSEVKEALRERPVQGLIAFGDIVLVRAAHIAEELGLPFYSPATATRLTNKFEQRQAFRAAGIPTPRSVLLPAGVSAATCRAIVADVTFPVIVKPTVGNGSRGVYSVDDVASLVALVEAGTLARADQDVVVEEQITDSWRVDERPYADYVSVESFLSHGRASHFTLTGRMPRAEPFRETGAFQPSNVSPEEWQMAIEAAEEALAALGAEIGVFHTEVKFAPEGCRIVEVNGRLGGGRIGQIASLVTGRSLFREAGRVALGEEVDVSGSQFSAIGFYYGHQPPVGARTIVGLDGLDAVRQFPGVLEVVVNRRPGDPLWGWEEGSRGYIYSVYGKVDTYDELWAMLDRVRDTVRISYET